MLLSAQIKDKTETTPEFIEYIKTQFELTNNAPVLLAKMHFRTIAQDLKLTPDAFVTMARNEGFYVDCRFINPTTAFRGTIDSIKITLP